MTPVKKLTVLQLDDKAKYAMDLMATNGFLSLPVVEGDRFVGFLSKQYLYDTFFAEGDGNIDVFFNKPVREFIHNRVQPVKENLFIEEAADIFFKDKVRFIPVVDDYDHFIGIITQNALFGILTKIYGLQRSKISILTDNYKGVLSQISEIISKNNGNIHNIALLDTEVMGTQEISIRLEGDDIDKIVRKLQDSGFKVREYVK